jgi:hypothetical protein
MSNERKFFQLFRVPHVLAEKQLVERRLANRRLTKRRLEHLAINIWPKDVLAEKHLAERRLDERRLANPIFGQHSYELPFGLEQIV